MTNVLVRRAGPGDGVAEIVLDRPDARNALSTAMAIELAATARELAHDASLRCVVLSSSSELAFCVGADLKERNAFSDADLMRQRVHYRAAFGGVLNLPMPTVAAVAGYALGGGFELALSCDLIVADDTAVVGLPEVTVGVIPGGGGTQLVVRRVRRLACRRSHLHRTAAGRRRGGSLRTRRSASARGNSANSCARTGRADRGELASRRTQCEARAAARCRYRSIGRSGGGGRGLASDRVLRRPPGGRGRVQRQAPSDLAGELIAQDIELPRGQNTNRNNTSRTAMTKAMMAIIRVFIEPPMSGATGS